MAHATIRIKINLRNPSPEKIESLTPEIMLAIGEAINEGADILVDAIYQTAPVDTGTMRNSARKELMGTIVKLNTVSVIVGGRQFINPKTHRPCDYAPMVERRQPFVKLALRSIMPEIERILTANLNQIVRD